MEPCERKLFKKVGTVLVLETVPLVKVTGPKPMIPSTPSNPEAEEAAPNDCFDTVRPAYETGPSFSVPETSPDPYVTEKLLPVLVPQDDETAAPAPAYPRRSIWVKHNKEVGDSYGTYPCIGRASVDNEVKLLRAEGNLSDVRDILINGRPAGSARREKFRVFVVHRNTGNVALQHIMSSDGLAGSAFANRDHSALLVLSG